MITFQEVKDFINTSPDEEARLELLIAAVESQWINLTGRTFEEVVGGITTLLVEGTFPRSLFVPNTPLTNIESIYERKGGIGKYINATDEGWVLVAETEYDIVDASCGEVLRLSNYWKPLVKVTYSGGATIPGTADIPISVKYALLIQVAHLRRRNAEELLLLQSQDFQGGKGVFHDADYHPAFLSTVKMYRASAI